MQETTKDKDSGHYNTFVESGVLVLATEQGRKDFKESIELAGTEIDAMKKVVETTLDLAFNNDSKDQKKGFIDVLQTERFQEGLRNLGYIQAEGETTKELEEKIENAYKDLFERFGKEIEVGFYTIEDLDTKDPEYMRKLTDSGFVGDDGKIWVNKTIIDSGKPLELNSVFAHDGVHVIKGAGSELLADFGESRGREFIQEAINNGSIKVETSGVSDWGNSTLTTEERDKLANVQGIQDRIYLDPSLTKEQRDKLLSALQEGIDHKLEYIEENGRYRVVIAPGGESTNKENTDNDKIKYFIENKFDNELTFGEVDATYVSKEQYEAALKYYELDEKYKQLGIPELDPNKPINELMEIMNEKKKIIDSLTPEDKKIVADREAAFNNFKEINETSKKNKNDPAYISVTEEEFLVPVRVNGEKNTVEEPVDLNIKVKHELFGHGDSNNKGIKYDENDLVDNFFNNSNGQKVYDGNEISQKKYELTTISDKFQNELTQGIYVKEDNFFKNSALTNELTSIIGQEKTKEIQEYIKNNKGKGYEVKLEPIIVNGQITGIALIQLMGQTKEEIKAVGAENESRKNQDLPERAGYGTGR